MEESFIPYDCSTHVDRKCKHSTEYMVMHCMIKYVSADEFDKWFRSRNIKDERRHVCVICKNTCERCILKNVGLPIPASDY